MIDNILFIITWAVFLRKYIYKVASISLSRIFFPLSYSIVYDKYVT